MTMTAVLLSQMWDGAGDHMGRGWSWLMGIGWLVFLGLVVVLIVILVRHFTQINPTRGPAAEEVLAERFARGEIDENEFRRRREALRV
jgi:putative membrane protein